MKSDFVFRGLMVALLLVLLMPTGFVYALDGVPGTDFFADRIVVSVQKGVSIVPADFSSKAPHTGYVDLDHILASENIVKIEKFYKGRLSKEALREVVDRLYVFYIGDNGILESAISSISANGHIEIAEPYYISRVYYVPNDPLIAAWYQLRNIEAYLAWDFIRGDSTSRPVLGIVDSGVYYDHPELEPNMWINSAEDINGDGVFTDADINELDDDSNGYDDDVVGWDFGNNDNIPFEPYPYHGTHVAGCATMACDNGIGGAAAGWGARIMACKGSGSNPEYVPYGWDGVIYAIENGATVINLSWGRSGSPSQTEQNICNSAYSSGVVIVAAAGNDDTSARSYPAAYNHVVAVASVNSGDVRSYFSNYGTWVDIAAPGEGVNSTWDHNSYTSLQGTSMASPIVAGVVCLIRAARPNISVDSVVNLMLNSADTIDYLNPDYEGMLGSGRVNAAAAVGRELFPRFQFQTSGISLTEDDGDGVLNPAERFNLSVTVSNIWQSASNITGVLRSDGQFTILDSVANFGNISGNGGQGNNSSNPFDIRVNQNAFVGSHEFTLVLTTGTGFQSQVTLPVSISLEQAGFPGNIPGNIDSPALVLNIDADAGKEIIVGATDHNFYSFESNGTQTAGWPVAIAHEAPGGAAAGDLDHDGDIEVVGMSRNGNIYAWNANGSSVAGFPRTLGSLMFGTPVVGDIDGDSLKEIVVGTFTSKQVYLLHNDGTDYGNWPYQGVGYFYGAASLADIDNDGQKEIIICDLDSTVHAWNADKTYVPGFPVRLSGQIRAAAAVADIDGDGNLNIVVGTSIGDLYVLDNDGSVLPGWPQRAGSALYSSPSLGDIDRDGRLEIIDGCNDWRLYVYNNDGTTQSGFPLQTNGIITGSPAIGDINGDSYPDIVFGAYDGRIYAVNYQSQPLRNFPITVTNPGEIPGSVALADIDNDGDCEIVVGVRTSGNNLEVIDYKDDITSQPFPWPQFGKDIGRTGYYGPFVTGIEDDLAPIPVSLMLGQNYPNPFNLETVIGFALPSRSDVSLEIFDLLGRRIRVLYQGQLDAGEHAALWDGLSESGTPVSSGVYFYRLRTGDETLTKRMTLMK
jgi:subtilisin family serine protease